MDSGKVRRACRTASTALVSAFATRPGRGLRSSRATCLCAFCSTSAAADRLPPDRASAARTSASANSSKASSSRPPSGSRGGGGEREAEDPPPALRFAARATRVAAIVAVMWPLSLDTKTFVPTEPGRASSAQASYQLLSPSSHPKESSPMLAPAGGRGSGSSPPSTRKTLLLFLTFNSFLSFDSNSSSSIGLGRERRESRSHQQGPVARSANQWLWRCTRKAPTAWAGSLRSSLPSGCSAGSNFNPARARATRSTWMLKLPPSADPSKFSRALGRPPRRRCSFLSRSKPISARSPGPKRGPCRRLFTQCTPQRLPSWRSW
mmetsp:Transcript_34120/g.77263  ORF Transcript_34120/g.77263 Transcript_34120/m.77263 type:complete len:321 (-) Transcript_34120:30-992(-)